MVKHWFAAGLAMVCLPTIALAAPRSLTTAEMRTVSAAVALKLKDPQSAQFRWNAYLNDKTGSYCGFVNSKNSYGGYPGFQPFMAIIGPDAQGKTVVGIVFMDDAGATAVAELCAKNGYNLDPSAAQP